MDGAPSRRVMTHISKVDRGALVTRFHLRYGDVFKTPWFVKMVKALIVDHSIIWTYTPLPSKMGAYDLTGLSKGTFVIDGYRFQIAAPSTITTLATFVAEKNLSVAVVIPRCIPSKQHIFGMATYLTLPADTRKRVIIYLGAELERKGKMVGLDEFTWFGEAYPDLADVMTVGPQDRFEGPTYASVAELIDANSDLTPAPQRDIIKRCAIAPPLLRVTLRTVVAGGLETFLKSLTFDLEVDVMTAVDISLVFITSPDGPPTHFKVIAFFDQKAVEFDVADYAITFHRPTPANVTAFVAFLQTTGADPRNFSLKMPDDPEILASALATGIPLK